MPSPVNVYYFALGVFSMGWHFEDGHVMATSAMVAAISIGAHLRLLWLARKMVRR